jgi:putative salt-induced outer membrane protein YdiY/small nuclear ribonucleoprotein (snRNP)-like protein
MRLLTTIVSVLSVSTLLADQVTLKNGDRITGSIVIKDEKTLTIKSEFLGEVTLPWDQVQTLRADEPVNVVLSDGKTLQGTITTRDQRVEIDAAGVRQEAPLSEITALRDAAEQRAYERLLSPGWGQLWAGAAALGFAGTQGNAKTRTLTVGLSATRVTNSDKTSLYFNAIRASALIGSILEETAQAVRGGWGYSRNVSSRVFVNGFNDYEYDRFQNLDLRFVLGGGLGYMAWKGERGRLDLLGGGAYNRESFAATSTQAEFTRNSAEAYFGDDFTYGLNSATSLYQNMRFFPNLSNTGEYRMNFDMGANTKLKNWLTWNIAISNRLLSNPVPGRQKNDLLYTTGIGVTFSR